MATLIENALSMESAKANIKSAIEEKGQDLTNVPFTEYASKIKDIESGGSSGGSSDLIDVKELPTTNVKDSKVYRILGDASCFYHCSYDGYNYSDPIHFKNGMIVSSIDDVTDPIVTESSGDDFTVAVVYTDKSTGIGYFWLDIYGTGVPERLSLGDFFSMMFEMPIPDCGFINNEDEITEPGVYCILQTTETTIGVPNATNNKNIMQYDGTEWKEVCAGGSVGGNFEFRFPDGAVLTPQIYSYVYDDQYTIYSNDNQNNGRTWLFDKTTGETIEIFGYGQIAHFEKYGDFVCCGGLDRYGKSFIYNVKKRELVKIFNAGYHNIQIIDDGVLFSENGNGCAYYNFSTGKSVDNGFNMPVSAKFFKVTPEKYISIYSGYIWACDFSKLSCYTVKLPTDIPSASSTKSHSIETLDENTALVAGGTFVGILDVNTDEFIQYMSGSNMSPVCSQLQHIKRVGPYYLCVNYEYSYGKIIKVDFDNNEYSILMEGVQYPKVILTHTDWENAIILANSKMFFFDSSDESVTQISTNSLSSVDYFEQINEIDLLFVTGSYLYNLNITDGSFTYKTVGNARTVIKGTDKYLIVPTTQTGSGYIYMTSSDLSDFTQITTGVQVITTVKQKGDQYNIYTRNFDTTNLDTIIEYVFSTGKDQLVMLTAKNIDEMFQ